MRDCPNHSVVHTFYYHYNSLLLSEIAEVLGYADDSDYFRALSDAATVAPPVFDSGEVIVYEGDAIIRENNAFAEKTPGIIQVNKVMERIIIQIESGKYRFIVQRNYIFSGQA